MLKTQNSLVKHFICKLYMAISHTNMFYLLQFDLFNVYYKIYSVNKKITSRKTWLCFVYYFVCVVVSSDWFSSHRILHFLWNQSSQFQHRNRVGPESLHLIPSECRHNSERNTLQYSDESRNEFLTDVFPVVEIPTDRGRMEAQVQPQPSLEGH